MSKYSLLKYSRSYPPDDLDHVACKPTSCDAVWQHFAFPELYLYFGRGDKGELQTALLKILWTKDIILEEMDLLSFGSRSSSLSFVPSQASQGQNGTSSSLRVVYRDSVVGFRYTKSFQQTCTNQPSKYRRFQISFPDPSTATQFVNMLSPICLCKLSSNPPNIIPRTHIFSAAQNIPSFQYAQNQSQGQSHSQSQSQTINAIDSFPQRIFFAADKVNTAYNPNDGFQHGSSQPTADQHTNYVNIESSVSGIPQPSPTPPRAEKIAGSSSASENNYPTLTNIEHLNNMNTDQLEHLVANLIRNPRFSFLLETIDSLWRLKGLPLDRNSRS